MDYKIREIRKNEYPILSDFLYEVIFIPEGMDKPQKSISFTVVVAGWKTLSRKAKADLTLLLSAVIPKQ